MKKTWMRVYMVCLLILLLIFPFLYQFQPVQAFDSTPKTVRIAYPIQKNLTEVDEQGTLRGFTYEYLQEIAQYTGWKYEFVQMEGTYNEQLMQAMGMLERGEVDIMGGVLYNEAMGEQYEYAGHSYGTVETILQVLYDDTSFDSINPAVMMKMKIAVLKNSTKSREELEDYYKMHMITPEYVECNTPEEQIQALKDGSAQAMLNNSLNKLDENVRTIAKIAQKPFYFVTTKGDPKHIIPDLNMALSSIDQMDPHFSLYTFEKYFAPNSGELIFSNIEKTYLEHADVLKVGYLSDQRPLQYTDEETGIEKGIEIDFLHYISKVTGLQFETVEAASLEELLGFVKDGKVDFIAGITYDYDMAQDNELSMTRNYLTSPYIMLTKKGSNEQFSEDKKIALTMDSKLHEIVDGEIIRYETMLECIKAVKNGEADITYVGSYVAQYYMNLPESNKLQMIPQTFEPRKISFGIDHMGDRELLSILNKCIISMPTKEMQSIIYVNTLNHQSFSLSYFVKENPLEAIAIIMTFMVCIIALLLFILRQRTLHSKKAAIELNRRIRLYNLLNEYFFEYDYESNTCIVSQPSDEQGTSTPPILFDSVDMRLDGDKSEQTKAFLKILTDREDGIKDVQLLCHDNQVHWLRFVIETIYDDAGVPVYCIGKVNVIDDEKKEKERLTEKASRDSLTHVYNMDTCRSLVIEKLHGLQATQQGALVLLDIDYFKNINDTYGHLRGDEVLVKFANILESSFQDEDIVGRPGGDEFLVYIHQVQDDAEICSLCDRLLQDVQSILLEGNKKVTLSIGVKLASSGEAYEDLFAKADKALYKAKRQGRNRYEIFYD